MPNLNDKNKYLEILVKYSNDIYTKSISKIPPGTNLAVKGEDNRLHVNDLVIEAFAEIIGMDILGGKVSVYEMAYVLMYLSELLFGINNSYREVPIEEIIFKPLLDNVNDETVGFLINGNNL